MENQSIIIFLITYFKDWHHLLFWILIAIVCLIEGIKNSIKSRNKIRDWLRKHNIGRKY